MGQGIPILCFFPKGVQYIVNEELWSEFYNEAAKAIQENDLDNAEANWRRAWGQVRNLEHNDGRYLMTLEYFGDLLCQREKLEEAEPLMLELLEAKEAVFEGSDLRIATTHNALAGLYFTKKAYDRAEFHCQKALEMHKTELGKEDPDVLLIMQNLAMVYHASQAFDKAEPAYEKAIELAEKLHGPTNTLTLSITENYVGLLKATGKKRKVRKTKKTLMLPVLERLIRVVGEEEPAPQTNKGFAGSTLTGLKRDPRKSDQCLYRIKPLPVPENPAAHKPLHQKKD